MRASGFKGYACGLSGSGDAKEQFEAVGAEETVLKPIGKHDLEGVLSRAWSSKKRAAGRQHGPEVLKS